MVEVSYLYNILYHTSLFSIDCCLSDLYPLRDDLTTDGQFYMTLKRSHCFFWAKGGVVVRARASYQSSLDSRPGVDAISGLSLLLVRGVLGLILLGMCRWPLGAPTPSWSILWPIIDPIVTFGLICNFRDPNLVSFCFYEWTHFLDWMKNTWLFICSTNILVRLLIANMKNCLTPKSPKMCDPILVTLLKMRRHYSQSSCENATPSSGTSPLASYGEVPPPPPREVFSLSSGFSPSSLKPTFPNSNSTRNGLRRTICYQC